MPWVIWDILVPMLATFLIGLATGWLLWRWRRQKVNAAATSMQATPAPLQASDDSANIQLIEERDGALARADAAEAEIETLQGQIELSVMGQSDNHQAQALLAASDELSSDTTSAEVEALSRELEKEQASKADVERSLVDLNTRYKELSVRLDEEVSAEAADALKNAAVLESSFEKANITIAEQGAKLKRLEDNEQTIKQQYEQDLAVKEAQLKQERIEREEVRMQLAREKLANEKAAADAAANAAAAANSTDSAADSATVQHQPHKVRHLTGYSVGSGNKPTLSDESASADTPLANNATESSSNALSGQPQAEANQSMQGNRVTVQSSSALASHLPGSHSRETTGLSTSAGHGSVARAESSPALEIEDPVVDESLQEIVAAETMTIEDDEQDQTVAVSATEVNSPQAAAVSETKTEAVQQKVTSINEAPRKPVFARQSSSTTAVSKPKLAAKKKKGTSSGYLPTAWSVPEKAPLKAERDDLQEIKGVGPVLEKMLHKTGIYYFRQVALLDKKGVQELDDQLPQFSGRIQREKWVQQAKTLHRAKHGSAAK